MAIYLTRHGQTANNLNRVFQGSRIDAPLTELGKAQANAVANFLKDKNISYYFASSMGRTVETSKIINQVLGLNPIYLDDLIEQNFGTFDGKNIEKCRELYPEFQTHTLENTYPLGENLQDVIKRVQAIAKISHSLEKNVLITSHRMTTLAIILSLFPNLNIQDCLIENSQCVVIDGQNLQILSF
jgi:probable phosphoglycerate mutase